MRHWIMRMGFERGKFWSGWRLRGGTGARNHLRATKAKIGERSYQEPLHVATRRAKRLRRRVFEVFGGTYDFGVFSAVPLPFIFYGKREGEPNGDPSEDPHPHRQS